MSFNHHENETNVKQTTTESATANETTAQPVNPIQPPKENISMPNTTQTGAAPIFNPQAIQSNGFGGNANINDSVNQQAQSSAQQPFTREGLFSLGIGSGALSRRVPRNRISANVESYRKVMVEIIESIPEMLDSSLGEWDLLVFDKNKNQATVSGLIFTYSSDNFVVAAPIFLSDTAARLEDRPMNGQYGQYPVKQLPEEFYTTDSRLATRVENFVRTQFPNATYVPVPGLFVPPEVKADLDANEQELYNIVYSVNNAVQGYLYSLNPGSAKWNVAHKLPSEDIVQEVKFNAPYAGTASIFGTPIRSDVVVETTIVRKDNDLTATNQFGLGRVSSLPVSRVAGFVTLDYVIPQILANNGYMQQPGFVPGMQQQSPLACFVPQYIITSLDNETDAVTLESQLMALASATTVSSLNVYRHTFNPNFSRRDDKHDIGAITLDSGVPVLGPDGKELPRGVTDLKDPASNWQQFVNTYVHQDLTYFIDVAETSNLSFVQRLFIDAAGVNANDPQAQQRAQEYIIQAATNLTNGVFQWNVSEPIFSYTNNRVELGYYRDEKGDMHDLREIDYLWLLNTYQNDTKIAQDYMNTFANGIYSEEAYRFFLRDEKYKSMLAGNYEIRGWARRLQINPLFLHSLMEALKFAAGTIVMKNDYNVNQNNQRGSYQQAFGGLSAQSMNGMFVQGGYANGNVGATQTWRQFYAPQAGVPQFY